MRFRERRHLKPRIKNCPEHVEDHTVIFEDDLQEHVEQADMFEAEFREGVNKVIEKKGLQLPEEREESSGAAYDSPDIRELDLREKGISNVIWATGNK